MNNGEKAQVKLLNKTRVESKHMTGRRKKKSKWKEQQEEKKSARIKSNEVFPHCRSSGAAVPHSTLTCRNVIYVNYNSMAIKHYACVCCNVRNLVTCNLPNLDVYVPGYNLCRGWTKTSCQIGDQKGVNTRTGGNGISNENLEFCSWDIWPSLSQ